MSTPTAGGEVCRVLICEDSRTYAAGLTRLLLRDPEIEVVAVCVSAEDAIRKLAELHPRPDIVTMDLELPGMTGEDAIEQIMSVQPLPILVLSGAARAGVQAAASLGAGALEVQSKDALDLRDPDGSDATAFRRRVKLLSHVRVVRHPRARLGAAAARTVALTDGRRAVSVIGICASAGGPAAVATVLGQLPAQFAIPVLVVQHMARGFTEGFARWLDDRVPPPVSLARPGRLAPGVWVAPDGAHLVLARGDRLELVDGERSELHVPSGDVLLRSVAERAGSSGAAVVLTGMGRDGAAGLGAVRRAGGLAIAQDEASSAVFGMPKAAAESGAELVLGVTEIGQRLARLPRVEPSA